MKIVIYGKCIFVITSSVCLLIRLLFTATE